MNVSGSVGQSLRFGSLSTSTVTGKPNTPTKSSVASAEQHERSIKQPPLNEQVQSTVIFDQGAVALFAQHHHAKSTTGYSALVNQDQPSAKNETAVASYQAVDNLAQRESVQQMFGVDLFA